MDGLGCVYVLLLTVISRCASQSKELIYHVEEAKPNHTYVGNLSRDSHLRVNFTQQELGQLRFAFLALDTQYTKFFNVSKSFGILQTADVLDRENLCPYTTTICSLTLDIAVQSVSGSFFEIIRVKIIVDDINDRKPEFLQSEIFLDILESLTIGTSFPLSGASDMDVGVNSLIQYSMMPSTDLFGLKETKKLDGNSDLHVLLNKNLDREQEDAYQMLVLAKDGGFPQNTGTMTIKIRVLDANDNRPIFKNSTYTVSVKETSTINTIILQLNSTDLDIGKNGEIFYRFSSRTSTDIQSLFSLDEKTGVLRISKKLDYDQGHKYEFVAEASDKGNPPQASQAKVTINIVKDTSNNRPRITINTLSHSNIVFLPENSSVNNFVAHVAVVDNDIGINGDVTCMINTDMFALEPLYRKEYKVVVSQSLDRETNEEYEIKVTCMDGGTPALEVHDTFKIRLSDVNDNSPVFSTKSYTARIMENNEIGDPVAQVVATDLDIGSNAELQYQLHHDAGKLFVIQRKTGIILANQKFDRENTPEIKFQVIVMDGGNPSLTATTTVVLNVLDENDNYPKFSAEIISFSISENIDPGSTIGILSASDKDSGSNGIVTYAFVQSNMPNKHFIVKSDGTIKSSGEFDRESQSRYDFIVLAKDKGSPSLSSEATVVITIMDKNDNRPVITFPMPLNSTFQVPYHVAAETVVTRVRAFDTDAGLNGELLFSFSQGNNKLLFNIDSRSGYISVSRKMHLHDVGTYKLIVAVEDQGNPKKISWTNVDIVVTISNETSIAHGISGLSDENTTIVIVLAVITGVLSTVIIITICIIKRIDTKKHLYSAKDHERKAESPTINKEDISMLERGTRSALQRSGGPPKKPKEVSFSLQDDDTSRASFSSPSTYDSSIATNVLEVGYFLLYFLRL